MTYENVITFYPEEEMNVVVFVVIHCLIYTLHLICLMEWTDSKVWAQTGQSTQCLSIYFSRNYSGVPKKIPSTDVG